MVPTLLVLNVSEHVFSETKLFRLSSKKHAVYVFAELHLPSAPPTPESEVDENGSTDADTTAEDGEVDEDEEAEENLVPVGGDGGLQSVDGRRDQQQNGWPSSTKRPPQTVQGGGGGGGGVRHHEGKHRTGGKGSGVRFRAAGWPLILAAALVSAGGGRSR